MSIKVDVLKTNLNIDKLDEDLRASLGSLTTGAGYDGTTATAFLIDSATPENETTAFDIIVAHDHTILSTGQQLNVDLSVNRSNIDTRFDASVIKNKTPAQIYTFIENQIDGWSTLADEKSDLRKWLPLMAAAIAWKVQKG